VVLGLSAIAELNERSRVIKILRSNYLWNNRRKDIAFYNTEIEFIYLIQYIKRLRKSITIVLYFAYKDTVFLGDVHALNRQRTLLIH